MLCWKYLVCFECLGFGLMLSVRGNNAMVAYLWLFAEAEPGESHELALTFSEGVLRVGVGCHAGCCF